jgi:hypothetical protein
MACDRAERRRRLVRIATFIALLVGGLPLLAYPAVLLAGVMSLAGHRTGNEPSMRMAVASVCLIGSLIYPLIYGPCLVAAVATVRRANGRFSCGLSIAPIVYLVVLCACFVVWSTLG